MYTNFFGLREAPFNDNPDPRYLYRTRQTQKALNDLTDGIQARKGCILLTGEVGTGKTTLINCLRKSLQEWEIPTAFLFNSHLSTENLLEFMLIEFRIPYDIRLKGNLLLSLSNWLVWRFNAGETPVLIVDEAQGLTIEALEEIRLLLNLETTSQKLLQVVLAGQQELEKRLERQELRPLRQRITLRCKTAPFTCEETHRYIQERLRIGGATDPCIFEFAAMDAAHRYSGGIPRVLNLLCDEALASSYAHHVRPVPVYIVEESAREFGLQEIAIADAPGELAAAVGADFPQRLSAWPTESPSLLCTAPANVNLNIEETESKIASEAPCSVGSVAEESPRLPQHDAGLLSTEPREAETEIASTVLCSIGSVAEKSPLPLQHNPTLLSIGHDVPSPTVMKIPAKGITVLQPIQTKGASRTIQAPSESPFTDHFLRRMAAYAAKVTSRPRVVSAMRAVRPPKVRPARKLPATSSAVTAKSSNRAASSHSVAKLMVHWNRALDQWWTKHFSRQLCWKTFLWAALAGSILLVLAPGLSVWLPGRPFARVLCGFLGLLFWAVSLGCGTWLVMYSTTLPSQIVGRWSKLFALLLRWLREPTHL